MKIILFVYHASNIGGGTYCLLNILKEIDKNKYRPLVLLREEGDLVKEINALGIEVIFMPSMSLIPYNRSLFERGVISAYRKIKKSFSSFEALLDRINPDAVYLNTMMLAPYLKVAKAKGCKTIIHLREHWPFNEHKKQLFRLQQIISNYADEVVAINSYSASMLPYKSSTIVYDWIDLSQRYEYRPFNDIFKEDTSNLKVYLFTGGLQDIKGAAEVIDVFRTNVTDKTKRLLIVGATSHPNTAGIRNKIKFIMSKLGIYTYEYKVRKMIKSDSRIVCIPATYAVKHILEQAYCNISFFTIPHANLALAESIIVGTVPVAAKTEESIEYSNQGDLALLFEIGNRSDLLKRLNELDTNYELIKSKISKDGHLVEKMFNKERNVEILDNVFHKLFLNSK